MNFKYFALVGFLAINANICFAQPKAEAGKTTVAQAPAPLFVLKSGEKSVTFDASKNEALDVSTIDPNSIESISILKGEEAKQRYGDKGINGVVIITIKDLKMLPPALQAKFAPAKE